MKSDVVEMMLEQMADYGRQREGPQMASIFESNVQRAEIHEEKPDSPTLKVPIFFEEQKDMIQ